MNSQHKCLGDLTLAEVQTEGFKSLGTFVDAWIKAFGYWDPAEPLQPLQERFTA